MKTAVIIPCYNEAKTIERVIKDFREHLPHADIYVYDNNSTDGTYEIAKNAGAIPTLHRLHLFLKKRFSKAEPIWQSATD